MKATQDVANRKNCLRLTVLVLQIHSSSNHRPYYNTTALLLPDSTVAESGSLCVMDLVWYRLLNLLWKSFLQDLRDFRISSGVRDFACLRVAAGVVRSVWDLVFHALWDLWKRSVLNSTSEPYMANTFS